jgi:hypothetical protein
MLFLSPFSVQLKDEEMKTKKLSLDFRIGTEEAAQKKSSFLAN